MSSRLFSQYIPSFNKHICKLALAISLAASGAYSQANISNNQTSSPSLSESGNSSIIIVTKGRNGAEHFPELEKQLKSADHTALIKQAQAYLKEHPESDLALEILATAQFQSGDYQAAADNLIKATKLTKKSSGPWTKLGILLMESKKIDEAVSVLRQALEINPHDRIANQRLGMLYEYKRDYSNAITHYMLGLAGTDNDYLGVAVNLGRVLNTIKQTEKTIAVLGPRVKANTDIAEAHLVLASAYLNEKQYQKAILYFQQAQNLMPDSSEIELGLIMSLRGAEKLSDAHKAIDRLIEKKPDWLLAHYELAEILIAEGKLEQAIEVLKAAEKNGSETRYIPERLGKYHLDRKEYDVAEKYYQQAIATGEAKEYSYARLADLKLSKGEYENSVNTLLEGIKNIPKSINLRFRLGNTYASRAKYDEAKIQFKEALSLSPKDPRILRAYILTLGRLGEKQAAENVAKALYLMIPNSEGEAWLYASTLEANDHNEQAEQVYRDMLTNKPDNALALNNLAYLLSERNELKEAEALARKANDIKKGNASLLDTLGWILYKQHNYSGAVGVFNQAIKAGPESANLFYHRGAALQANGNKEAARADLGKALSLSPDAEWAIDAKTRLQQLTH
jgi:tetratricopeptide (TPR) repeat protein